MDECCAAGKSSFFDENRGFRSEGLQKSENAVLVPPWRMIILCVFFIKTLWPEMELFSFFLEAFFKTCDTMLRQWVVTFSKLVILC